MTYPLMRNAQVRVMNTLGNVDWINVAYPNQAVADPTDSLFDPALALVDYNDYTTTDGSANLIYQAQNASQRELMRGYLEYIITCCLRWQKAWNQHEVNLANQPPE